jgi:t-SNARE complex subunit (syntaxin)
MTQSEKEVLADAIRDGITQAKENERLVAREEQQAKEKKTRQGCMGCIGCVVVIIVVWCVIVFGIGLDDFFGY